jgi:hypothetical protein
MAYEFVKASSQYLSAPNNAALDITGAITLACWAKRGTDLSAAQILIGKFNGPANQRSFQLSLNTSGQLFLNLTQDGTNATTTQRTSTITTTVNTFQHFCGTWSPSDFPNVYIDGTISNGATSGVNTNTAIYSGTANLILGANYNGSALYYGGQLAEVGIWNAALTAAENASLARGMTCDKVRPQSLVFYAPLIRDLQDVRGGLTITNNNSATVATHPRVYA